MRYNMRMESKNLVKGTESIEKYAVRPAPDTFADALRAAIAGIHKRRAERGVRLDYRYILFVPDKYTLLAEKLLYGNGGAFDAEVLTLNRLYYRLAERSPVPLAEKPLSRLAAVLTVRRLLAENADKLICFQKSAAYPGFGETVYDNICQLASCGLTPEDLPDSTRNATGYKLHDLKLVFSLFRRATEGKYVDATGRLVLLNNLLGSTDYFDGADVSFACFDDFTPLQRRIVGRICGKSDCAAIYGSACSNTVKGDAVAYAAPSRADELKAAAVRIRNLHSRGVRYEQMGVIAPNADFNRLKRIFDEYGIPFFTDRKYPLSSHPLARYLLDLFAAAGSGTNENYIKLSKNPYAGVACEDADLFENYMYYCAFSEGAVAHEFTVEPDTPALTGARDCAERVRAHLFARVAAVRKREIASGADFCRAVLRALPSDEAEISARIQTPILHAREEIETCIAALGDAFATSASFKTFTDALEESFDADCVSVIPNRSDTVEVGEVPVFRASGYPYLFVLDLHEGELPPVMHDEGILTDNELDELQTLGAVIEPKIELLNRRAEAELDAVLASSEHLFLSYCTDCTPSPVLARIRKQLLPLGRWRETGLAAERRRLADAFAGDERTQAGRDYLARLCPTRASARELCLIGAGELAAGGRGLGCESELREAVGEQESAAVPSPVLASAGRLYHGRLSVSRVQEYFACPFRCFLRYGLKLAPRPDGQVSPLDLGTFLHRVIELFVRDCRDKNEYVSSPEKIRSIVRDIVRDEPRLLRGASDGFIEELTEESIGISAVVAEQIGKGEFKPLLLEEKFGRGAALKGHEIRLPEGELTLEGIIDRLDVCTLHNAARVIDYKTGYAEFSLADIYHGRKVQLAVYLKVAEENGYTPAGMFYFPFSSGFAADRNSYRLMGIFDERYAYEMDRGLALPKYSSDVVRARSTTATSSEKVVLNKSGCAGVAGDTLRAVCDYAEAVLCVGAREMLSGYCESAPLYDGKFGECGYCEMKPVCSAYGGERRERKKRAVKADFLALCNDTARETENR